jgi:hypothetical protein
MEPEGTGSSLKLSKPRPPSGDRCMFTVGPRITLAPLAIASWPMSSPLAWMSFVSQVAASAVPQGKQAAGIPLKNRVTRMPLGSSEVRIEEIPSLGIACVCQ